MYFRVLRKISWFQFFEIDDYAMNYMNLLPDDPVNEKFESIGIDSKYFINNMGSFFLFLCFDLLLILVWALLIPASPRIKAIKRCNRKLGRALYWNS